MNNKIMFAVLVVVAAFFVKAPAAFAQDETSNFLPIYGEKLDNDCVRAGIVGDYLSDAKDALARINAIRYEACQQGVPNPEKPSSKLKPSDYVPIKWSSEMESIARLRAAESSIRFAHVRPNDKNCFTVESPGGKYSNAETLAWCGGGNMCVGINLWYSEKKQWIKTKDSAGAGHYSIMINPAYKYVGIANFSGTQAYYRTTICAEFSRDIGKQNTSMMKEVKACTKFVQVKNKYLKSIDMKKIDGSKLKIGDKVSGYVRAKASISGYETTLYVKDNKSWVSSNSKVIAVDKQGKILVKGYGVAVVTVKSLDNKQYSSRIVIKVPTAKVTGIKAGKKSISLSWAKGKNTVNGYSVKVSTDKDFKKNVRTVEVSGKDKTSVKIGDLKSNKKYYAKVRMKTGSGKNIVYGKWSSVLTATTK